MSVVHKPSGLSGWSNVHVIKIVTSNARGMSGAFGQWSNNFASVMFLTPVKYLPSKIAGDVWIQLHNHVPANETDSATG